MKHNKELDELLIALEREEIPLPQITLDKHSGDNYWWCIETNSQTLDLNTSIYGTFELRLPAQISLTDAVNKTSHLMLADPTLRYSPIQRKNHDGDEIDPVEWKDIPQKYRIQAERIKKLDTALPNDSTSINLRTQIARPGQTFCELYSDLVINEKLKWADIQGEHFPYVTTTHEMIGEVGRSEGGLYFVSTDIASEPWQEIIVAYHERFCQTRGHEIAVEQEIQLAQHMGKSDEHQLWRTRINLDASNGKYY